ncbi:MAG: PQQ-dependent sugar dehydrogenase [Deltaproteobacteria bacterium]|nr:PQQ-dependent sugar dehydrogenase [Deltaproteobacteria bacterium]
MQLFWGASCKKEHDTCGHPLVDVPVVGALAAPQGYVATRVLDGLVRPTMLAFDDRGRLFILEGSPYGDGKSVRVFRAADRVELSRVTIATSGESTGILAMPDGGGLFVASRGRVDFHREFPDGSGFASGDAGEAVVTGLPNGWHTNNNLRQGPDGRVYFGIGATCDVCTESDPLSATIVRFDPNAARPVAPEVFARGLRNVYDLTFTDAGDLIATDNGPECCEPSAECLGDAPDRVVVVREGAHYGWPYLQQASGVPANVTVSPWIANTPKHVGITGIVEYQGSQLCRDRGNLFATYWGTEHAESETGRQVVRIRLLRDGGAIAGATLEPFLGQSGLGHPIAVAVGPDGALYVLDYQGFLVRVASVDANGNEVPDLCE